MPGVTVYQSAPSKCPMDAVDWGVRDVDWISDGTTWTYNRIDAVNRGAGFPEIDIICSQGRNTCPDSHPYSFNFGKQCCISPFHDVNPDGLSGVLLKPQNVAIECLGPSVDPYVDCPLTGNRNG